MPLSGAIHCFGSVLMRGALCVLGVAGQASGADPTFNFDDFTGNKPFTLNTMWTTPFGPPWADVLLKKENFLACRGAEIALCYYSGPEAPQTPGGAATPCDLSSAGTANCTCYAIPAGHPYFVDINAILNLDVYLDTVKKCDTDGSRCQPNGPHLAPVCDAVDGGALIPGAELISTFSLALAVDRDIPLGSTACYKPTVPDPLYAGCMTAPCKKLRDPNGSPVTDPYTGLELAQCACPLWAGDFQVGQGTKDDPEPCDLGDNNVWSAAYSPKQELIPALPPPPPPNPNNCWPDVPGDAGCPLLSPNPPAIPPPPVNVSCKEVCSEYKKSNQKGIEVGFTCDATLCTAPSEVALVKEACTGLAKNSIAGILELEIAVGLSCAASQICGCEPNKKTNEEIWRLNEAQSALGIDTQCKLNGTLCGTKP